MKKLIVACAVAALSGLASAAVNDMLVSFSTPGPDTYANDGTVVKDGESYALVFTPAGKTFAGIAANGEPVDPETGVIALVAPVAKGGRCPRILFDVDAGFVAEKCDNGNGTWSVWLLDTRRADGSLAAFKNGRPTAIAAAGEVIAQVQADAGGEKGDAAVETAATAESPVAAPADAPQPTVSDFRVKDGFAYVTLKNTAAYLQYNLASGVTVDAIGGATAEQPVQGGATVDDEVILVKPCAGNSEFFRPIRHPWSKKTTN